jgi:predicted ATPase
MRIDEIQIQNFKSFKDVKIDLKDLNLFIGANNSGKTNFFRGLVFLKSLFDDFRKAKSKLKENSFNKQGVSAKNPFSFSILHKYDDRSYVFKIEIYDIEEESYAFFCGIAIGQEVNIDFKLSNLNYIDKHFYSYNINTTGNEYLSLVKPGFNSKELDVIYNKQLNSGRNIRFYKHSTDSSFQEVQHYSELRYFLQGSHYFDSFELELIQLIESIKIYKPDPNKIVRPYPLFGDDSVNEDASNLVSFFDKMKDINTEVMESINTDLSSCIKEFKDIRFDTVKSDNPDYNSLKELYHRDTFKKIGVSDANNKNIYWAEELSEGALYFIALLAIVHQPNPPKILLLEEPEKGIHPRRIEQTITYLQKLCAEKDIQIVLTTHSPIVVDQFSHDISKIFVFDKANGETTISNLEKDIIEPKNKKLAENKIKPLEYAEALGENWIMGLLNGIPND